VDVVLVGDAGADVEELADACVAGEVAHGPAKEGAVGPDIGSRVVDAAHSGGGVLDCLAVGGEVVGAAQ
jgi:hypothetical protein